eukprot:3539211-Prymnesium_polylepis.1
MANTSNTANTANTANRAQTGRAATAVHPACAQPPTPRTRPCMKRVRSHQPTRGPSGGSRGP